MAVSESTTPAIQRPVLNALEAWTTFALPPISMEMPLAWYPRLSQWASNNARVRWESLTETPLEVSWTWDERKEGQSFDSVSSRLETAWKKEQQSAEEQARTAGIEFKWQGSSFKISESKSARYGLPDDADGFTRRYSWEGREGVLAVLYLEGADRRALVALALCPAPEPTSKSQRDSTAVIKRVFSSLKLTAKKDPSLISFPGLRAVFPAGMTLDTIKPGAGQLFLDWHSPDRRFSLIRMNFADQHLALALETARKTKKGKGPNLSTLDDGWRMVSETLAMRLFDRSEGPGMLYQIAGSPSGAHSAQAPADATEMPAPVEVNGHACVLFAEKRPFYVRWGDTALRGIGRKWSGEGLAALWRCEETGALWGLGVRAEPEKTRRELDALLPLIDCHNQPGHAEVDWLSLMNSSLKRVVKTPKVSEVPKDGKPVEPPPPNAVDLRIKQFQFRLKPQPNVRLEVSSKDRTGRLVYELASPTGLLARLSGANKPGKPYYRTLDLDPLGRRVWELLEKEPTIGELLGTLSREMRVHPVEFYELVLSFLRMLGERGLATAGGTPSGS